MQLPEAAGVLSGGKMVVTRFSQKGEDRAALEYLEKLASQDNVTDAEVEAALAEYEEQSQADVDARETYEMMRERYKREKAQTNFESGGGSFRRSK
jgi:hypothetical protein